MATRAALVRAILKELGVYQAGQDLPPEDYRAVDEELNFKLLALAKARIYASIRRTRSPTRRCRNWRAISPANTPRCSGSPTPNWRSVQKNQDSAEMALRFHRTRRPTYSIQRSERC